MQKQLIFLLISLVYIVHCGDNDSYQSINCKRLENKIYLLKVTFPDLQPLYAALRLLPYGTFDELFSIAGGNNAAEVGANFAMSNRFGYYKCLKNNYFRGTGLGFLYETVDVPFLKDNGATVTHDYHFRFSHDYKNCTGLVKFGVYKCGTDPFKTYDKPVYEGKIGKVTCELLRFQRKYDLSGIPK